MILPENKSREGLGFSSSSTEVVNKDVVTRPIPEVFYSRGFIHPTLPEVSVIIEDDPEKDSPDLVVHGLVCQNWTTIDVPLLYPQIYPTSYHILKTSTLSTYLIHIISDAFVLNDHSNPQAQDMGFIC